MLLLLLLLPTLFAQSQRQHKEQFFVDIASFRGKGSHAERVDLYILLPYASLLFVRDGQYFVARYEITVHFWQGEQRVVDTTVFGQVETMEEAVASGATGGFDSVQIVTWVPPGKYRCQVEIFDVKAKERWQWKQEFRVTDYHRFPFSLSSILFVSDVEKQEGGWVITPYPSADVTALLPEELFIYVEAYAQAPPADAAYKIELLDSRKQIVAAFPSERIRLQDTITPLVRRLPLPEGLASGTYQLSITLHKPVAGSVRQEDILGVSMRPLVIRANILRYAYISDEELEEAIRQLRYVATSEEIAYIAAGETLRERRKRFLAFWKKLDPTPKTERNEAFEEYYRRVQEANRLFSTYRPGWLTDRGKVYIIYGPPESRERIVDPRTGFYIERWYYPGNRIFEFVDPTGFGDYRLVTPLPPTAKYRYPS